MQGDRGIKPCDSDRCDDLAEAHASCLVEKPFQQNPPPSHASETRVEVDRNLSRIAIGGPRLPGHEQCKADNAGVYTAHQDRISGIRRCTQASLPVAHQGRFEIEGDHRFGDIVPVDLCHASGIGFLGTSDFHRSQGRQAVALRMAAAGWQHQLRRPEMIGALLLGFVAGVVARVLMPGDVFRKMSGRVVGAVARPETRRRCPPLRDIYSRPGHR